MNAAHLEIFFFATVKSFGKKKNLKAPQQRDCSIFFPTIHDSFAFKWRVYTCVSSWASVLSQLLTSCTIRKWNAISLVPTFILCLYSHLLLLLNYQLVKQTAQLHCNQAHKKWWMFLCGQGVWCALFLCSLNLVINYLVTLALYSHSISFTFMIAM